MSIQARILLMCLSIIFKVTIAAAQKVDATTMQNKVMAGYQGWFRTPGDTEGNKGWAHLFNGPVPSPAKLAFDTWPDMSELSENEKYPVPGFRYADSTQAYLYSAQNYQTVLRHFQWMQQYGLDGVWLSEFCGHFPGGGAQADSNAVLQIMQNVRKATAATGRTWAFMWDMSGISTRMSKQQVFDLITRQWRKMVDEGITRDDRYMHEKGKPVLLIWGFFPNRPASQPDYMNPVIDFLLKPGKYQATLVAGVDPNWRREGSTEFQAMLMKMQGLQPWSVGRRMKDTATGYAVQNMTLWEGDIERCRQHQVLFMPVLNAGTHIAGPPPSAGTRITVPRRMGNYLWQQFENVSQKKLNAVFLAMFDEINEGTQLMKIDLHPPVQAPFLTYDGATSDYYLRLTGKAATMLKNKEPITFPIPISPFNKVGLYNLKFVSDSSYLAANGSETTPKVLEGKGWLIIYDEKGYFMISESHSGKLLSAQKNPHVTTLKMSNAGDSEKWRFEWDENGYCRIISKNTGLTLTNITHQLELQKGSTVRSAQWQIIPE